MLALCVMAVTLWAGETNAARMLRAARQVLQGDSPIECVETTDQLAVYRRQGGGFVIIAAGNQSPRVLAYSTTSTLSLNDGNPGFNWWMRAVQRHLRAAGAIETTKPDPERFPAHVDALITTKWGQREPFKFMCPFDTYLPDRSLDGTYQPDMGHFVVGCVATAMAQYMNYYKFPQRGVGQDSVTVKYSTANVVYRVDFEEADYDWDNMLDTYGTYYDEEGNPYSAPYTDEQGMAVARLCYHCGVAAQNNYASSGSGSTDDKCLKAFTTHFNYNDTAHFIARNEYEEPAWMEMVYTELSNRHPIFYSGRDISYDPFILAAHNFIIDGYDENGMVHVNWGWYGLEDGYYDIALLNPRQYSYDEWQAMYGLISQL